MAPTSSNPSRVKALQTGLRELGYVEGKNIAIEFRWAETVEQLSEFAAELVRINVDIIFATSSTEVGDCPTTDENDSHRVRDPCGPQVTWPVSPIPAGLTIQESFLPRADEVIE